MSWLVIEEILACFFNRMSFSARFSDDDHTCCVSFTKMQVRKAFAQVNGEVLGLEAVESAMPSSPAVEETRIRLETRSNWSDDQMTVYETALTTSINPRMDE